MKFKNISKKLLVSIFIAGSCVSCSEDKMDEINKDLNHTTNVVSKLIITDVITSTAFSQVGGDFNTYLSTYVEHEVGTHAQLYNAEVRVGEPSSSSTFNNVWGGLYSTIKNAKIIISKCSEGGKEEGNYVTKGVAELLLAYNLAFATDMFGDIPWLEAGDYTVSLTPKLDKQELIYQDVLKLIDSSIANLKLSDVSGMAGQDLIYGGNADKWIKTAYGLKARYIMRLIARSANVKEDMNTVLDCVSKSFTSADEQCSFNQYTGSNLNPYFGFFKARESTAASTSMFDKLVERKDPRVGRCFIDPNEKIIISSAQDTLLYLAPNGSPIASQLDYNASVFTAAQSAPTHLLSYHEVLFLKAEALARLDNVSGAQDALKEAVIVALANTERSVSAALVSPLSAVEESTSIAVTPEAAAAHFNANIKPLFSANPLKEVMMQKYIAFFGANGESPESYNDIRRMKALGENFIELKNPNKFPLRCPYGGDDTTANPNVKEAFGDGQYVYTENVWWAGGTR